MFLDSRCGPLVVTKWLAAYDTVSGGKDLYDFWDDSITKALNKQLKKNGDDVFLNLASNEYFKSVHVLSLIHI